MVNVVSRNRAGTPLLPPQRQTSSVPASAPSASTPVTPPGTPAALGGASQFTAGGSAPLTPESPGKVALKGTASQSLLGARMAAVQAARTGEAAEVGAARATAVGIKELVDPSLPNAFLKVKKYALSIHRPGVKDPQTVEVTALRGPREQDGCSMVATLVMDPRTGAPCAVLKLGDTRLAPTLRGEDYVGVGMTGGRWDYEGVTPEKIGVSEIAEELGGGVRAFFPVSGPCVPTMPHEAMEVDAYYTAVIQLGDRKIEGDGGGMEVPSLMRPGMMRMDEALAAMDNGLVREGARARVAYSRALDAMGYIPQLGMYARDLPPALRRRWTDLGARPAGSNAPFIAPLPDARAGTLNTVPPSELRTLNPGNTHRIQRLAPSETTTALPALGGTFISTQTQHITADGVTPPGKAVPNQVLSLGHDRAKCVLFARDERGGLLVKMDWVERPLMAAKGLARQPGVVYPQENTDLTRLDTADVPVKVTDGEGRPLPPADARRTVAEAARSWAAAQRGAPPVELGAPTFASPGQTQMKYQFFASEVEAPRARGGGFMPLADALKRIRTEGHGDAATEALLLRLASHHDFIPGLGMTGAQARALLQQ